jgi:hypothetical protein
MSRIVRLTESDITRIVRRVINEQAQKPNWLWNTNKFNGDIYFKTSANSSEHIFSCSKGMVIDDSNNPKNFPLLMDDKGAVAYMKSLCAGK